jgi:hypothetical protein|tara:strand:+ start:144 stop:380 length:237 start_codon:yes stop_codon:yes gene_type:complete
MSLSVALFYSMVLVLPYGFILALIIHLCGRVRLMRTEDGISVMTIVRGYMSSILAKHGTTDYGSGSEERGSCISEKHI